MQLQLIFDWRGLSRKRPKFGWVASVVTVGLDILRSVSLSSSKGFEKNRGIYSASSRSNLQVKLLSELSEKEAIEIGFNSSNGDSMILCSSYACWFRGFRKALLVVLGAWRRGLGLRSS